MTFSSYVYFSIIGMPGAQKNRALDLPGTRVTAVSYHMGTGN